MAKLMYKRHFDGRLSGSGMSLFVVVDYGNRRYILDDRFTEARGMYPFVGAYSFYQAEELYTITHGCSMPHNVESNYYDIHSNKKAQFYGVMKVVMDLYKGQNVTLYVGNWDDLSLELFNDYLYTRYGIQGYEADDYINDIPDVEFDPDKIDTLQLDLEEFRYMLYTIKHEGDYYDLNFNTIFR